jgi:hypothetical protein
MEWFVQTRGAGLHAGTAAIVLKKKEVAALWLSITE